MSAITTHVLDTSRGCPAGGVPVLLEMQDTGGKWRVIGQGVTDGDGRLRDLLPSDYQLAAGVYRLIFNTTTYFSSRGEGSFYPEVAVVFSVRDASQHFHVPLLLNPYGYSTYRGS